MSEKKHPWAKFVIKDEKLVISLGDYLRLIAPVDLSEESEELMHLEPEGQVYRAYDRKGVGWDLELISGNGPPHIRALNGDVFRHFELLSDFIKLPNETKTVL